MVNNFFAQIKKSVKKAHRILKPYFTDKYSNLDLEADSPFKSGLTNVFSHFPCGIGIYVFYNDDGILYVGAAHTQILKKRVSQNYTLKNSGGTFRNRFCGFKNEDVSFKSFLNLLKRSRLTFFVFDKDTNKNLVKALEILLIQSLEPEYNKEKYDKNR